mmetsp:Transcript_22786/g.57952  ORF Transcript_22786/g.57952 Transcript_22786/m.57952 type:complete len:238 (-) Transcript_22786:495-1208(-)
MMQSEMPSSTVPMMVAPMKSYCSRHWKMRTGAMRSLNAKLEEMMTMDPNSPSARENASAVPVSSGGSSGGSSTVVKAFQGVAPRVYAASSTSACISWMTGCMVRTTKGKDTNTMAMATPKRVNTTGSPTASRKRPSTVSSLYTVARVRPATDVGRAKGRSTAASIHLRPGKSYLTSTHASRKPKTALTAAAASAHEKDTKYACTATGSKAREMNRLGGVRDALDRRATMGTTSMSRR